MFFTIQFFSCWHIKTCLLSRHNEDGSYTYGYEAADGSFKLETRYPDGLVQGKYGYIDENGEVKVRKRHPMSTSLNCHNFFFSC